MSVKTEDLSHFWKNVKKTDSCWLWTGRKDPDGYGLIVHKGKQVRAHRLSYEIHWSIIPPSYIVRHTCDTPGCVNPEHLLFGSSKQNAHDMVVRNRSNKNKVIPRVSNDIKSKIAVEYDMGGITAHELSKKYNVNRRTVSRIIKASRNGTLVSTKEPNYSNKEVVEEIRELLKRLTELVNLLQ